MKRLQFAPFWKLTQWGFLPEYLGRIQRWGNPKRLNHTVIIPLVGEFILWDKNEHDTLNCLNCVAEAKEMGLSIQEYLAKYEEDYEEENA